MKRVKNLMERFTYLMLMPLHKMAVMALGVYTFAWGCWVASPFWDVFTHAPLYATLSAFAPEWTWGVIAIICGVLIIVGAIKMSYDSLVTGARVAFGHWLLIAIFYFVGDWHNTGGITSLFIAIYAAWVALNLKVNHSGNNKNMEDMFS